MDGTLIAGRYRRRERLGAGGMASVWRARDERTGRDVAVKVLHPHLADDDRQRGRLRHEAHALASIDDVHVVPVLDVVEDGEVAAIVMPRIEGETLSDRLAASGSLPEPEALDVAVAVAEALAAAHAVGLVHRDVKPSNILLGSDGVVRLMDFGIAADLDATTELTADGVVGTLRYLAPERLLGEPAVPATDVWGLGVVLLEMLTGRPAYPGASLGERLDAAGDAVARPTAASEATWAVIRRAADGDPTRRYQDGSRLLAALRDARDAVGTTDAEAATAVIPVIEAATPLPVGPALAGRTVGSPRRSPTVVAAAIAILLVAGSGLAVIALDPGPRGSGAGSAPAAAPDVPEASRSAAPTPETTPVPAVVEQADGGDGEGEGQAEGRDKGNGKGKSKGDDKDKP